MTLEQAYYTSCRTGLGSGVGFQINAASPGLSPAQLYEVQRWGQYSPPTGSPERPTIDELAADDLFPLALYYRRLPNDAAIVGQSRYIGKDYSNRYGNYFAHTLVSLDAERDFANIHPIELWRAPFWVSQEAATTTLPPLQITEWQRRIDEAASRQFIRAEGRAGRLAQFLTATELALSARRRILIVAENSEAVALWIAIAVFVLPAKLSLSVTFTTYAKDPYATDAMITGITNQPATFQFSAMEMQSGQFSVFDFQGQRFTPLPVSPFAERLANLYLSSDDATLRDFRTFARRATHISELAPTLDRFLLLRGHGAQNIDPVALLRNAAQDREQEETELSALLSQIVGTIPPGSPAYEAWKTLHSAFRNTGKQLVVEHWLLAWIQQRFAQIDPQQLAGIFFSERGRREAERQQTVWLEHLKSVNVLPLFFSWLAVALATGAIQDQHALHELGSDKLGPWLGDHTVQLKIRELARMRAAAPVIQGVAEYCGSRAADDKFFSGLREFMTDSSIFALFEQYAVGAPAHRLLGRLYALGAGKSGKTDRFRRLIEGLRKSGHLNAYNVHFAYRCLWPSPPEITETLEILQALEGCDGTVASFTEELVQGLKTRINFFEPDRALVRAVDLLLQREEARSSPHLPLLLAYSRMKLLWAGTASASTYLDVLPIAEAFNDPERSQFVQAVLEELVSKPRSRIHSAVVREASRHDDMYFLESYRWMAMVVASSHAGTANWLSGLIEVWEAEKDRLSSRFFESFLDLIPRLAEELSSRDQKQVSRLLKKNEQALALWENRRVPESSSAPAAGSWFKKMFGRRSQ